MYTKESRVQETVVAIVPRCLSKKIKSKSILHVHLLVKNVLSESLNCERHLQQTQWKLYDASCLKGIRSYFTSVLCTFLVNVSWTRKDSMTWQFVCCKCLSVPVSLHLLIGKSIVCGKSQMKSLLLFVHFEVCFESKVNIACI